MNEGQQNDDLRRFRALGEWYGALVEETGRTELLLHEAEQRLMVARDDGAPRKPRGAPLPESLTRPASR